MLSYQENILKPQSDFFIRGIKKLGLRPEEVLYFDDKLANIEAAKRLGILGIFISPGKDLRSQLTTHFKQHALTHATT